MFEKVNPSHPDKVADRIAGAMVDLAYEKQADPKIAVEVLIGHGVCHIIAETSVHISAEETESIVRRIAGNLQTDYAEVPQDAHLADNQSGKIRCGDNGIFKGMPVTDEQCILTAVADNVYHTFPYDGKYILDGERLIICQSNADRYTLEGMYPSAEVNPIGDWTGGPDVDSGATNRKLGSDMADSVTGGGLHGKDLSKADVSVNIWAWILAQKTGEPVELCCAIGDETVAGIPYQEIVETAREYISNIGGFEKFAEWGLLRYEDNN
jgi:S-adenosylmethionine synthetase